MQQFELPEFGIDQLQLVEVAAPEPGAGQVLVQFGGASINYRDYQIVSGEFAPTQPLPIVPLSDGAGRVAAVGDGVTGFQVGDCVAPLFFPHWHSGAALAAERSLSSGLEVPGVLRELGVYDEAHIAKVAAHLSAADAACFPCAGLTAWSCLQDLSGVKADDIVLVQGTGGVSIFGLQFAKAMGATVIVTSGSDAKLERALELGADFVINYRATPEWGIAARDLTGGRGVDAIIEIGGQGTLQQSFAALARGGHISIVGYLAGIDVGLTVFDLIERNANLHGVSVGNRDSFVAMMRFVEQHQIQPVISSRHDFTSAATALREIVAGEHIGKIVVDF
jgi:NADPH:quinone reductase-like Zn-dependent oxidoreductase